MSEIDGRRPGLRRGRREGSPAGASVRPRVHPLRRRRAARRQSHCLAAPSCMTERPPSEHLRLLSHSTGRLRHLRRGAGRRRRADLSALIRRSNPSCARCASRGGYAARAQGAFCAWLDFERECGLDAACGHKAPALAAGFNRRCLSSDRTLLSDGLVWGGEVNVDTDNQCAFTRGLAGHVLDHREGVLTADGGIGDKHSFAREWAAPERQRWRSGSGKRASSSDRLDAASAGGE